MGIIEYSKSAFLVYDFSVPEIRIFNRKKRQICYLLLFCSFYQMVMTIFHTWNNSYIHRLSFLIMLVTILRSELRLTKNFSERKDSGDFTVTPSYYQILFDGSVAWTHFSMVRMYIYLLISDYRKDFRKFEWLEFLWIEDEQTLIQDHYFTAKEATSYLRLIGLFLKFVRINGLFYWSGCCCVMGRLLYMAYNTIPLHWFLLSTVPNVVGVMFNTQNAFRQYNYLVLTYFANAMFTRKSLRSLGDQQSALYRYKLKKSRLTQLAKQNLLQFNFIIKQFQQSQANFNYTFCYSLGLIFICFSYPYTLLFTNLDLLSFLSTLLLYIQAMVITIWLLLIKINSYVTSAVQDYSNYLHLLIYECPSISLKLKLGNFFSIHQPENRISYKYMWQMWELTNRWFLTFLLESISIVILIYNFNYFRTVST